MNKLGYEFLDPFMEKEIVKENLSMLQVLVDFDAIPWYKLVMRYFLGNINPEDGKGNISPRNDFWYFNISCVDAKHKKLGMLIVPNFASKESFSENDLRFSLEYIRPKMLEVSKWRKFFGVRNQKLKKDFSSCLKGISIDDTKAMISSFLNGELQLLENKITEATPLMSNSFD